MRKQLRGSLLLLLTALIWGSAFVAQSKGMEHIGPFTYNGIRTLIGGIVLLPVIALFSRSRSGPQAQMTAEEKAVCRKSTWLGGLCCGLALCVASSFQQYGIQYTSAGKAGFITALYIVIVPILGLLFRRKVRKTVWACVAVAIVGFWLLCIKADFSLGLGDLLVLICAFFFSVHILVIDHFSPKADCIKMSCIQFFVAGLVCLIPAFLFESPTLTSILDAKWSILYAGVLSSGVAYTLQILGQRDTEPTVATLLMSLESVFSALSGWLILHESLSAKELIGCGLVFIAVVFAQVPLPLRKQNHTSAS